MKNVSPYEFARLISPLGQSCYSFFFFFFLITCLSAYTHTHSSQRITSLLQYTLRSLVANYIIIIIIILLLSLLLLLLLLLNNK